MMTTDRLRKSHDPPVKSLPNHGRSSSLRHYPLPTMTPSRLIVVCCHGIWQGGPHNGHDESEWLIAGFQQGETPTFIEHIKAGVSCLAENRDALLVFSG